MPFDAEVSDIQTWTSLQAEHDLLAAAIRARRIHGVVDYLNRRVVDRRRRLAVYRVAGMGRGEGHCFALVHAGQIIAYDIDASGVAEMTLLSVTLPENLDGRRQELLALLAESVRAFQDACPVVFQVREGAHVLMDKVRWTIVPTPGSRLFWTMRRKAWLSTVKRRLVRCIHFTNIPAVAVVTVFAAIALGPLLGYSQAWPILPGVVWLKWRASAQDPDQAFFAWFFGRPRGALAFYAELKERAKPVPLAWLAVQVRRDPEHTHSVILRLTNSSMFFVTHVTLMPVDLARVLAPGYVETLRRADGSLDPMKLDHAFEGPAQHWLLPFQSRTWRLRLRMDFPPVEEMGVVTAVVSTARRATGQRRAGPQLCWLAVRWRT